jgi:peptide/nickel transport system substrate-binding protein
MNQSYWDRLLTRKVSRRRALAATGATALGSALLIACGGGGSSGFKFDDSGSSREPGSVWFTKNDYKLEDETKQAVKGGIYRGSMSSENEGHYDSIVLPSSQAPFSAHVHEMLMGRSVQPGVPAEEAKAVPALAQSWEFSPDGMTITFTMRPNVKWHPIAPVNGRVMDMDDWKTSYDRWIASSPNRTSFVETVDRYSTPDATHMVWHMKFPYGPINERIYDDKYAFMVQPKELNANIPLAEKTAIGTGYKVLDKHERSITMEYRKHTDYWGGEAFIDRWHAPLIPEYANRYAQFVNGNITDLEPIARDILLLHRDAPDAVIVGESIPIDNASRMRFGRISPQDWPWADPRARIAIRRSIDYASIGKFLSNQEELQRNGITVEVSPMTHLPQNPTYWLNPDNGDLGELSQNYLFNIAEAKKLTAAAGYNEPITLPFYVELSGGEPGQADQLVMDSLNASGVFKLDIHGSRSSTEHRRYRSLGEMDGIVAQSSSTQVADYFIFEDYHSSAVPDTEMPLPYIDRKMEEIGEAYRRELDVEKSYELLREWQRYMAQTMTAVPGRHLFTTFRFRHPWLHNAHWGQFGGTLPSGRPGWGSHFGWLDKDMPSRGG